MTEYVVLRRNDADGSGDWTELPMTQEAASADQACRAGARGPDGMTRGGDYKAVPARSWRGGVRLRPEQREVVHVEALADVMAPARNGQLVDAGERAGMAGV